MDPEFEALVKDLRLRMELFHENWYIKSTAASDPKLRRWLEGKRQALIDCRQRIEDRVKKLGPERLAEARRLAFPEFYGEERKWIEISRN